ncbi:MAG: DNA cytosine methyltransferase [Acidimicrobiia bacterium]|nr:DNA cytosine methyltransferase [Acidimicrobiia bacterium]
MKILNLYACLGGNRYKWDEVTDIEVTAVELDPECARLYQERFPNDKVIVADAHQYLLDHYKEFDFIWSSPPCPTHSRLVTSNKNKIKMKYPDMNLYQEVIFLDNFFKGKYVVENVIPFYTPLIPSKKRGRHLYWTNFNLPNDINERPPVGIGQGVNEVKRLCEFHDYDFYKYKGKQPTNKIARNLVDYEAGKTILETAVGIVRKQNVNQTELF